MGETLSQDTAYVPPKDWEALNDSEKIERMREIIKSLSMQVSRTQSDIHKMRSGFAKHSHSENGIVVPYNEYGGEGIGGVAKLSNEKYF